MESIEPPLQIVSASNHMVDGIPQSYEKFQLCRTKCGKHFVGYCRGGQWYYKCDIEGRKLSFVPDEYEVEYWADLD